LQVLDEGRLTDNKGRLADFRNAIIIMTSNMGSAIIQENFEDKGETLDDAVLEKTKSEVLSLLKRSIRPEFLNRIDEIVMFKPLNKQEVKEIVQIQIDALKSLLTTKNIRLEISDLAINYLAETGFEPQFGARPIKRVIQKNILNELSKQILSGNLNANGKIKIDFSNGQLTFNNTQD
jgi:ATP-dependent Clp protease ATP-binding subunit ClpB